MALSPSRPFIERPVATSLLMLALLLAGLVAFKFLPLSALPEVDYPTIQVTDLLSGGEPGGDGHHGHRAARSAVRPDDPARPHELDQLGRLIGHHASVRPVPAAGRGRAGGPGGDQRGHQPAAHRPALAADLRQGEPGRRAGADPGAHLQDACRSPTCRRWPTSSSRRRSRSRPASDWSP